MSDDDATFVVDADVPAFLKDIDKMAEGAQTRFQKLGSMLAGVLGIKQTSGGGSWNQTPVAKTTKEMQDQHKIALELLKVERQKRDIVRAERFERNRGKYGAGVELTEEGELRKHRRDIQSYKTIGAVGRGLTAAGNFAFSGGSLQGGMQLGNSIATMLAPQLAPVFNAITGVAIQALDADDRVKEAALRGYQVGGVGGANQLLDPNDLTNSARKQLGFNSDRFSSLQTQLSRRQGDDRGITGIMRGENEFGVGGQMANLQGSGYRTGSIGKNDDPTKLFGAAFGLQIGEGIGRGRLGEIMDQLSAAMEANTEATTDVKETADRFLFISQLGPQFKGNTAAAQGMDQSIKGLAQGATGYTQMKALQAAGFGQGKSFTQALMATQMGVDVTGGVRHEDLISSNFRDALPKYKMANEKGKADIIFGLARLTGMSMPKIKYIMDGLASGQMSSLDIEGSTTAFTAATNAPEKEGLIGLHRQQVNAESAKTGVAGFLRSAREKLGLTTADDVKSGKMYPSSSRNSLPDVPGSTPWAGSNQGSGSGTTSKEFLSKYVNKGEGRYDSPHHQGKGIDLEFPPGTMVYSPCDGVVIAARVGAGMEVGFGLLIKDASTGDIWRIFHLDPATVSGTLRTGVNVTKGQPLGRTSKFELGKNVPSHVHVGMSHDVAGKQHIDPSTVANLETMIHPIGGVVRSQSRSLNKSQTPQAASPTVSGTRAAMASESAAASAASVNVVISVVDKTSGGIDAHKEVQRHAADVKKPAPGDTPAKH